MTGQIAHPAVVMEEHRKEEGNAALKVVLVRKQLPERVTGTYHVKVKQSKLYV